MVVPTVVVVVVLVVVVVVVVGGVVVVVVVVVVGVPVHGCTLFDLTVSPPSPAELITWMRYVLAPGKVKDAKLYVAVLLFENVASALRPESKNVPIPGR